MSKFSMKGASWDSIFLASAKILTMAIGILIAKILSVGLSLEEYGTYSQANLINTVGASVIALGLSDAVNYFFNRRQSDVDDTLRMRIVNTVFFVEIVVGVILAFSIFVCRHLIVDYFDNAALQRLIPFVMAMPMLSHLLYFYQVLFVSIGKAKIMTLFNLVMMVLRIAFISLAVFVLRDLLWIFLLLVLLELIQITGFNLLVSKQGVQVLPWQISLKHIKQILAYGLPIGIYTITSSLSRELDKLVIGRMETTEVLAVYSNCSRLLPFDVLVISFATVLIPYIIRYVTEGDSKNSISLFSAYLKVGYYSVWILGAAALIAPQTMISLLYADAYTTGAGIFVLYVFDSMLRFASAHLILTAANKSKLLLGYSLLSLALNFVLNIALYFAIGIEGPAVATLISSLVYAWLILHRSFKIIHARWRDIFAYKEIIWLLLTVVAGWLLAVTLNRTLLHLQIHPYIAMIISMVLFGCGMLVLHFKAIVAVLKQINTFKM